ACICPACRRLQRREPGPPWRIGHDNKPGAATKPAKQGGMGQNSSWSSRTWAENARYAHAIRDQEASMRYLTAALILGLAFALAGTGEARAGAWCAWYDPYTHNCGFNTIQQCQATVLGAGGYCARNVNESQRG